MAIAGIDIGTTGCKCSVYNVDGELLHESYREYRSKISEEFHMISPIIVWEAVKDVVKESCSDVVDLQAIGVTSFGEAAILLDEYDEPILDSLLFSDPNGREECNELINELGLDYLNKSTGLNPDIMYTIIKLMWIKKNEPLRFSKCKKICLFENYIVYKLSGVHQIDYSLASRTMAFNLEHLDWDQRILGFAEVDINLLPKVVPVGTKAGVIKKEIAKELGLNSEVDIITGCHDQIAAAIGTGVYKDGMAVDGTGTVECITTVFDDQNEGINHQRLYEGSFAQAPFVNQLNVAYAFSFTGGSLLKWYREKIGKYDAKMNKKPDQSDYDYYNSKLLNKKPSGLLILPYFAGAGTPHMDIDVKGVMLGLTLDTTSEDMYKGLMESVTYEMRLNLEKLKEAGIHIDAIRATGGGANSPIWLQMKADILNIPVTSLKSQQSGTLGCIILTGLACGIYKSLEEADNIFIKTKDTYLPDPNRSTEYKRYYEEYIKIYPQIKDIKL